MRAQQKKQWHVGIQKVALVCETWLRSKVIVSATEVGQIVPEHAPLLMQLADLDWTLDELLECREGCLVWEQWQSLCKRAAACGRLPMLWLQQRRGPLLVMMPTRIEHSATRMRWRLPIEPLGLEVTPQLVSWVWLEAVDPRSLAAQAKATRDSH